MRSNGDVNIQSEGLQGRRNGLADSWGPLDGKNGPSYLLLENQPPLAGGPEPRRKSHISEPISGGVRVLVLVQIRDDV